MTREEFEAIPADYYDTDDSEELEHDAIEDAVADRLDCWATPDCDMLALIREHSPVKVKAFRRTVVSDQWIAATAHAALEAIADRFAEEEFSDPDGGDNGLGAAAINASLPTMIAAVREFIARGIVWGCTEVGRYSYSAAEVETMMRVHNPEWFEPAEKTS